MYLLCRILLSFSAEIPNRNLTPKLHQIRQITQVRALTSAFNFACDQLNVVFRSHTTYSHMKATRQFHSLVAFSYILYSIDEDTLFKEQLNSPRKRYYKIVARGL